MIFILKFYEKLTYIYIVYKLVKKNNEINYESIPYSLVLIYVYNFLYSVPNM